MGVIRMANAVQDAKFWSVEQMLEDALDEVRAGKRPGKAVVVWVDDSAKQFHVGWSQAGLNTHELIAALEIAKVLFLQEMHYIPES